MEIKSAKYEGGRLILETSDMDARRLPYQFKSGQYELVRQKKKRSLDANAYCWQLLNKLGGVLNLPPVEIYRQLIKDVPENNIILPIADNELDKWRRTWESRGLGWQTEIWGRSKLEGYTNVICYYGSSTYDNKQMSQLIDLVVTECKAQDIETLTPEELARLEWGE